MNNTNYKPNDCSAVRPFPKSIFLLNDFKLLVERSVQLTEIGKRFKPRLYDHSDFIISKLFAIMKGWSTHDAAEYLINVVKWMLYGIRKENHKNSRIICGKEDLSPIKQKLINISED